MADSFQDRNILRLLARAAGIATSHIDYRDKKVRTPPAVLRGMISAMLDVDLTDQTTPADLRGLYRTLRQRALDGMLPPTIVAWDGKFPHLWAWLAQDTDAITCSLIPEDDLGPALEETVDATAHPTRRTIEGRSYVRKKISWDAPIPYGYYTFRICANGQTSRDALLISAPVHMKALPRCWGAFMPTYALRAEKSCGIGGYAELLEAARLIKKQGGEFVGTLPLLPVMYEGPRPETSPYSPVSRLFWNEIYLDLDHLPGPYTASRPCPDELNGEGVDYPACHAHKKSILKEASRQFFETYPDGDELFRSYVQKNTHLRDYADFLARKLDADNYDDACRYYLYCQYACHLQLLRIKEEIDAGQAASLYLDYTVGVHPDGFDAQRISSLFLKGYDVGAPPDKTFRQGQSWGFEPLHPRRLEESRYQYFRECLHHYFQYANLLRMDHVMGLYRLYCIPKGMSAKDGTYVYYNLDAQMGVLSLEAWRHNASVIGEDLGLVPDRIRDAMEYHHLNRMWVAQNEIRSRLKNSFSSIKPDMIAVMNTHDMFPFAAYMQGEDLRKMNQKGFIDDKETAKLSGERKKNISSLEGTASPYLTALDHMARSPAQMVMVNIEDLWGETEPQNVPGTTGTENWSRKFVHSINSWPDLPLFQQAAKLLNSHRMSTP